MVECGDELSFLFIKPEILQKIIKFDSIKTNHPNAKDF